MFVAIVNEFWHYRIEKRLSTSRRSPPFKAVGTLILYTGLDSRSVYKQRCKHKKCPLLASFLALKYGERCKYTLIYQYSQI